MDIKRSGGGIVEVLYLERITWRDFKIIENPQSPISRPGFELVPF
jgi:hypothetical protein